MASTCGLGLCLLLVAAAGACNDGTTSESGVDAGPTGYGRVSGTIELDTRRAATRTPPIAPGDVHVALVWYATLDDASKRPWVSQELEILRIGTSWPAEFELLITEPPPPGAIRYELGYSQAKFVAYHDKNGNGRLDWTPTTADAFVDEVVAYHPRLFLWFFTDGGLKLMLPGSGDLVDPATPIQLLERADLRSSCHLLEWLPRFSFESQRHSYDDPDQGDQGPFDSQGFTRCPTDEPPDGARVACQPGGPSAYQYYTSWSSETSAFVGTTCGPVIRTCEGRRADPQAPGPWPCPCDAARYTCVDYQLEI